MYSPFNLSTSRAFVTQELTREYLSFPDEIDEIYSDVIKWLSNLDGMTDFDKTRNVDLDSHQMPHTGRQFSQFLPAHTMKVYRTLLEVEDKAINEKNNKFLDQPHILIIDDGCGGGTASIAFISLIVHYQKYKLAHKLPIFPVKIDCVGIDINDNALKIYGIFLKGCVIRLKDLLIDIKNIKTFYGTLPQNTAPIIEWITEQDRIHCVILALANIFRPLQKEYEEASKVRGFFDKLGLSSLLFNRFGQDIGAGEVTALNAMLIACKIDQIVTLLIGAHSTDTSGQRKHWRNEMEAFQNAVNNKLANSHQITTVSIKPCRIKIINPSDSFYRKYRDSDRSKLIEYDSGSVVIHHKNYYEDIDWQKVLEPTNLLLAWARVRNALSYQMIEDTLEIRLFEAHIEERLNKLRGDILTYQWELLNVEEMLNFQVPKGVEKSPRPMSLCRLEDQILATAILQIKAQEYSTAHHPRSYAYKLLAKQKGEQLYEDWFSQYQQEYLADAWKIAQQHPSYLIIRTDLSSYYTDIVQPKLFEVVEGPLNLYNSRGNILAKKLINRDCGVEKNGQGIPQGHIMSGALANLYLAKVDHLFGSNNPWGVEYFRFVDDIILMLPPNIKAEFILDQLDQALSELGLTRSLNKTSKPMTSQEFLEITVPDDILERLSKEHNFLLSDLYKLGRNYIKICLLDWWGFVEHYQRLLASIGVYLSVPRLSRKLQKNMRWWNRTFNWWYKLEMPQVNDLGDLKDIDKWKSQFVQCQSKSTKGWINRREKLVQELITLFQNSLANLDSEIEVESVRAKTHLKFALNRLGQLGFGSEANIVINLIVERPWVLPIRRVCHDLALQGYENLLIEAFNRISNQDGNEWGYVRSAILKALSSLPTTSNETILLLYNTAFTGKTMLERTMASESLFLLQEAAGLQRDELINAIQQSRDGYLSKNYALLYAITLGEGEKLRADLALKRILNEAIEFVRVAPTVEQLYRHEPEILREKFYDGDYPDDPTEFEDFPY